MDTWRRIIYFLFDILKYNTVIVDPDKTDVKQVDDTTFIALYFRHYITCQALSLSLVF